MNFHLPKKSILNFQILEILVASVGPKKGICDVLARVGSQRTIAKLYHFDQFFFFLLSAWFEV